uniref:Uncharacterized protein n=1 Tax=Rhizophora mucronata TaxID=61149 RepID=A0A2P2PU31_RHIMU
MSDVTHCLMENPSKYRTGTNNWTWNFECKKCRTISYTKSTEKLQSKQDRQHEKQCKCYV